jgi:cytochrome P450
MAVTEERTTKDPYADIPRDSALKMALARAVRSVVVPILLAKERLRSGVVFNPVAGEWHRDPVPMYERLRAKDPVHYSELIRGWVVSHHDIVDAVLRDFERFGNDPRRGANADALDAIEVVPSMLNLNPPDHTRMRSLVAQAFTPKAVNGWHDRIESVIDEIFADIGDAPRFDLMEKVAIPLPVVVIAEILGIPAADRGRFKVWSEDIARTLEPTMTQSEMYRARVSRVALEEYFGPVIEERRRNPKDDLITSLVQAEDAGDRLTHGELIATLVLLLVAGNETTTNLIGNGTLALLNHPEQLRWLREHPEQVDVAVEEMLRFDSPVQINGRRALVDVEIGGRQIKAGEQLILLQGSGNHDPERWHDQADAFDLSRGDKSHLSFGRGIHYCLGAPLARLEAQLLFPRMLERWPNMRLAAAPQFKDNIVLRGMRHLEVAVD